MRNLTTAQARKMAAARKTNGGPARVMTPCPWCRVKLSARELRAHLPRCPQARHRRGVS